MKLIDAYSKLTEIEQPVIETQDAAHYLKINVVHASKILSRLCDAKLMINLARSCWAFKDVDPLIIPQYITAPNLSYISLQTALYYHGMVSQIPQIIYAVSLARTRKYKTTLATISIHHIDPTFFFGYEMHEKSGVLLATPEKALLDVFYLSPAKTYLFRSLPEVELPKGFKIGKAREMIKQISSASRRTLVEKRFADLLEKIANRRSD